MCQDRPEYPAGVDTCGFMKQVLNLRLRIATQNFHRVRKLPKFFKRPQRYSDL